MVVCVWVPMVVELFSKTVLVWCLLEGLRESQRPIGTRIVLCGGHCFRALKNGGMIVVVRRFR